jgi:phage baseplate assembly protein W
MKKKFFSVKFPFTAEDERYKFYLDLNTTIYDSIRSDITHLLFTTPGTRLREPKFGSNLVRFLFLPGDDFTYNSIKSEVQTCVQRYLPHVTITDIEAVKSEDDERAITIKMNYKVDEGQFEVQDSLEITL